MPKKRIVIFDLDDTLIHSEAKIRVYDSKNNEILTSLTPSQFNYHVTGQTQYFSFEDFECEKILGRSKLYPTTYRSFKRYYTKGVPISIITARSNEKIVIDFFKTKGVKLRPSLVYAIHNRRHPFTGSVAERKKQAIQELIDKGYNDIVYYDDNFENLYAATELASDTVSVKIIHVQHD
jgi:FMN phosphatase YigB (HAD superfamily)